MYYRIRIFAVAAFAAAAFVSMRRAQADWEFRRATPASVARAAELAPSSTEYLLLRSLQLDYDGADATPLLERAAALNPLSSAPRIRLGLAAEIRGDNASAERWLLDAARIDRMFEPRWTLANFYFRRDDRPRFWEWIHAALEISYGDRRPAFDLCWRASSDAHEIERAIPDEREVIAAYLGYLLETRRIPEAAPVSLKLAAFHQGGDQPLLLGACDEFIAARQSSAAIDLWRALFGDHRGVFRPNFETPRIGQGFDWRSADIAGVDQLDLDQPPRRRIVLNGRQPESCELLRQTVVLQAGRTYRLHWQSQASGVKSGVEWRIAGARAALDAGVLSFTAPAELNALTLNYDRPQGKPRAEGSFEIWSVSVEEK